MPKRLKFFVENDVDKVAEAIHKYASDHNYEYIEAVPLCNECIMTDELYYDSLSYSELMCKSRIFRNEEYCIERIIDWALYFRDKNINGFLFEINFADDEYDTATLISLASKISF